MSGERTFTSAEVEEIVKNRQRDWVDTQVQAGLREVQVGLRELAVRVDQSNHFRELFGETLKELKEDWDRRQIIAIERRNHKQWWNSFWARGAAVVTVVLTLFTLVANIISTLAHTCLKAGGCS